MNQGMSNEELQSVWRIQPYQMVSFDIQKGEIEGFRMGGRTYARTESGENHFFCLPEELRQIIWKYALTTECGGVGLFKQENGHMIICGGRTGTDMKTPFNRILEVCKTFALEWMFMELFTNHLYVDHLGRHVLLKLLRVSQSLLAKTKREVTYMSPWGMYTPSPELLYDLLAFGKQNPKTTINIWLMRWRLLGLKPNDIREFVKFGRGLRQAIRGGNCGVKAMFSPVVKSWRSGRKLEEINVPNVRFFPAKEDLKGNVDVMSEKEWNKVRAACSVKVFKDHLRGYDFSKGDAIAKLVTDVKDYSNNGI